MPSLKPTLHTITVTSANFASLAKEGNLPILLDFWATWCVPCNFMKRAIEKAAETLSGEVVIGLVNVDEEPELLARFGVRGTPTFVLVKSGEVIQTFSGMTTSGGLVQRVRHHLSEA